MSDSRDKVRRCVANRSRTLEMDEIDLRSCIYPSRVSENLDFLLKQHKVSVLLGLYIRYLVGIPFSARCETKFMVFDAPMPEAQLSAVFQHKLRATQSQQQVPLPLFLRVVHG